MTPGPRTNEIQGVFKLETVTPVRKIRLKSGANLINGKYELRVHAKVSRRYSDLAGIITVVRAE
jgi:hypothetical protein